MSAKSSSNSNWADASDPLDADGQRTRATRCILFIICFSLLSYFHLVFCIFYP